MNATLLLEVGQIKKRAKETGISLSATPTLDSKSIIITNFDSGRVVLIGMVEASGSNTLKAYSVNVQKYHWALDEGFSREEIITEKSVSEQVFEEISLDKTIEHLL